jgi:hypothetical protein
VDGAMSDISLRFDGLLLGACLALAALIYLLLALGFGLGALASATRRADLAAVARTSAAFAVVSIIGVGATMAYMGRSGSAATGPDWIDWLSLPALLLFAWSGWHLARLRPR